MLSPLPAIRAYPPSFAEVGVGGCNAGQGRARRAAHRTKGAVLGQQAFHAVEDRFVQRHVNDLPQACGVAVLQRQKNADDTMQGRQRVAQADAHAHRHAPGLAGEVPQAAHGFSHHTETGAVAVGPGLAISR